MNKLKEALQKILEQLQINAMSLGTYGNHPIIEQGNKVVIKLATEALEQSEPRLFSESIIDEAEKYFHDKRMTIAKVDFLDYEDFISFIKHLSNRDIQSPNLSLPNIPYVEVEEEDVEQLAKQFIADEWFDSDEPVKFGIKVGYEEAFKVASAKKEKVYTQEENGLIKQQSEKWKKLNADFDSAIGRASSKGYFDKFSLLPESSNPIATDHTTIQPKETIEALAEKLLEKACPVLFKPSTDVKKAILAAMEEYASLGRTTTIQEIEEWVKENTESVENQSGDRGGAIWTSELLTKLQTLKP